MINVLHKRSTRPSTADVPGDVEHDAPGPIAWTPLPEGEGAAAPPDTVGAAAEAPSEAPSGSTEPAELDATARGLDTPTDASPSNPVADAFTPVEAARGGGDTTAADGEDGMSLAYAASLPRLAVQVQSLGPVGRRRSPFLVALLSVLTVGLYPAVWLMKATHEMADFDPRMVVRAGRSGLAFLIPALACVLLACAEAGRLFAAHAGVSVALPISENASFWLLLAPVAIPTLTLLVPTSLVAAVMAIERVRVVEDRAGVDPERQIRPAATLRWLLLPALGVAVLAVVAQRRLNRVWATSV